MTATPLPGPPCGYGAEATGASYRAVVERCRCLLPDGSEADQAKILGNNAASIFGFIR